MKFGFVAAHRGIWPTEVACEALGISRSGFYAWRRRPPSTRAQTDAAILATIRASFTLSSGTYGVRRILDEVRDAGHRCGRDRVGRLMRGAALRARPRRRAKPTDTGERSVHTLAPNVLDREFTATAPNQKWVADFTYLWTSEGWLYVLAKGQTTPARNVFTSVGKKIDDAFKAGAFSDAEHALLAGNVVMVLQRLTP